MLHELPKKKLFNTAQGRGHWEQEVKAKCLREKGINVSDPTQQEPKIDLSELDKSKDEIVPVLKECGYGESGYEK